MYLSLGIEDGLLIGLSNPPDSSHVSSLKMAIDEREVDFNEFAAFCESSGLEPSLESDTSACHFLAYSYGEPIVWLHLPHSPNGLKQLQRLLQWSNSNSFNVQDGKLLYCLLPIANAEPIGW